VRRLLPRGGGAFFWGESIVFLTADCTEWEFLQEETEVKDSLFPLLPSVGMGSVKDLAKNPLYSAYSLHSVVKILAVFLLFHLEGNIRGGGVAVAVFDPDVEPIETGFCGRCDRW
jgi:hypothetical protein